MIDPNELERLSNPREALEEAFKVIHPEPSREWETWDNARLAEQREEDKASFMRWNDWRVGRQARFRRFLDAEAWTDAALMLIPDNWTAWEMRSHAARSHFAADLSRLSECDAGQEDWAHGTGSHPALALAEAALRAKEAGNG